MTRRIATIRGTAMAPGVSLNGRLYSPAVIAKAVRRAQERLAGGEPLTMLTHHGAEDDSTRIVGRVTALEVAKDGSARFTADLADTAAGRDIAALVTGDTPMLDGVSIRGWWLGNVRQERGPDGEMVETADDLELDGLDFTKTPGVLAARIDRDRASATESTGRVLVYESATARVEPTRTPYGDVRYGDIGYRPDKVRRFPLDTAEHAQLAWQRLENEGSAYSSQQLKRIRARVREALDKFGAEMPSTRLGEVTEFYPEAGGAAGICIDAYNGPLSITMRACGIEPGDLRAIAAAAMDAACQALAAMDPDMDADIDVPGAPAEDTDGDMAESAPPTPSTNETTPAAPVGATITQEVPAVSEAQNTAAVEAAPAAPAPAAAPMYALTQEQLVALLAEARGGAAPVAETKAPEPVVEETEEQRITRLIAEGVKTATEGIEERMRAELRAVGPRRIGLVAKQTTESAASAPDKPLHEMTEEERNAYAQQALGGTFGFELGS